MKLWKIIQAHFAAHRARGKGSFFWRITVENLLVSLFFVLLLFAVSWTTGTDIPTRTDLDNIRLMGLFVSIVMIAPILETLLLQVLPVAIARKCGLTPWWQVALSAAVFALIHFTLGVATGICAGVAGGIYLGFAYVTWREKTGSGYWMTVALHATRNFIAFIFIAWATLGGETQAVVSGDNFRLEVQRVAEERDLRVYVLKIHVSDDAAKSKQVLLSYSIEGNGGGAVYLSDPAAGTMEDGEVVLSAARIVTSQSKNFAYAQMFIHVRATNNAGQLCSAGEPFICTVPKLPSMYYYLNLTAQDGVYPLNKPVKVAVVNDKHVMLNVGKLPGNIPPPVVKKSQPNTLEPIAPVRVP